MEGQTFGMSDFQPLSPPLLIRTTGESHQTTQSVEPFRVLDGSLAASSHDPQQIRRSLFEGGPLPVNTITMGRNHSNTSTPSPSSRENHFSSHSGVTYTDLVSPTGQVIRYRVHDNVSSTDYPLRASDPVVSQVIPYSSMISQTEPITSSIPQYGMPTDAPIITPVRAIAPSQTLVINENAYHQTSHSPMNMGRLATSSISHQNPSTHMGAPDAYWQH